MTRHTPERRVLTLGTLRDAPALGAFLAECAATALDWDFVLDRARRSLVWPAVALALRDAGALGGVPGVARDAARDAIVHTAAQNAALTRDLVAAVTALDARGVPSIALKGAALLAAHLREPGARYLLDIDLLVARAALPAALDALRAAGFRDAPAPGHDGAPRDPLAAEDHAAPAVIGPLGTPLELHWRVAGERDAPDVALARLAARARTVDLLGRRVTLPSPADLFEQLCVHAIWHHAGAPAYLARHVADAALLLDARAVDRAPRSDAPARVRLAIAATLALLDALRGDARRADRAARVVFPAGRTERAMHRVAHAAEVAQVADAVARAGPRAAWQRVFPARSYLEQLDDPSAADRTYAALWLRRIARHVR